MMLNFESLNLVRSLAIVRHDWMRSVLEDKNTRANEISHSLLQYSARAGRFDEEALRSSTLEGQADHVGLPELWTLFRESGIMNGDALTLRFAINHSGRGHVTNYEALFEAGKVIGFLACMHQDVAFPKSKGSTLELFEVVSRGSPGRVDALHRGANANCVVQDGPRRGNLADPYSSGDNLILRRVEEFVRVNFDRPLTISDLADAAGTSERRVQSTFREVLGIRPLKYLNEVRLKNARALLVCGRPGMTVSYAALHSGFTHLGRFSQSYFAAFGEQPLKTLQQFQSSRPRPK